MLLGLYIIIEDDFDTPLYAEPDPEDLDEAMWQEGCEHVQDAIEGEGPVNGHVLVGEAVVAWRTQRKAGVTFLAFTSDEVKPSALDRYLKELWDRYLDEVDDPRDPGGTGLDDVLVDVIPPWEDDED